MPAKEGRKLSSIDFSNRGPVRLRVVETEGATATLEIGVDYSAAPVPPLHYAADYCDVLRSRTGKTLLFGKLKPGSRELRTHIEIVFSDTHFMQQIWQNSRRLHRTVTNIAQENVLPAIEVEEQAERVQSFAANSVFMAVLGMEAVLDFYFISPGDIHIARGGKNHEIHLEPVVRIVTTAPLLYDLLEKCRPFAEELGVGEAREAGEEK